MGRRSLYPVSASRARAQTPTAQTDFTYTPLGPLLIDVSGFTAPNTEGGRGGFMHILTYSMQKTGTAESTEAPLCSHSI